LSKVKNNIKIVKRGAIYMYNRYIYVDNLYLYWNKELWLKLSKNIVELVNVLKIVKIEIIY